MTTQAPSARCLVMDDSTPTDGLPPLRDEPDLGRFRQRVRDWMAAHVPADWRERVRAGTHQQYLEFQRWWFTELRSAGLAVVHWPREWGGGYSLEQQVILFEESARARAPYNRLFYFSVNHAAATLLHAGSPQQVAHHLPRILAGQEIWCQGFSEPNAGSDLASLRTRAVRDRDDYVVNGQKIWTSNGPVADWCLLLARTDPDAPKRDGISYFLLDLKSPGVEVRPIRQASGAPEFAEVFFTDVRIPARNRIGDENRGWQVAQATLTSERGLLVIELADRLRGALHRLVCMARECTLDDGRPVLEDSHTRQQLAQLKTRVEILRLLCKKMVANILARGGVGPEASIIKLFYSELLQEVTQLGTRIEGLHAHLARPLLLGGGWETDTWLIDHIGSWAWTIAGGSNEIQRTVIGERVLGLPREPRPAAQAS